MRETKRLQIYKGIINENRKRDPTYPKEREHDTMCHRELREERKNILGSTSEYRKREKRREEWAHGLVRNGWGDNSEVLEPLIQRIVVACGEGVGKLVNKLGDQRTG